MGKIILGLLCLTASAYANDVLTAAASTSKQTSNQRKTSYDTDLFHKDQKVYFVNAEFLYWIVNEGALDYALQMKNPAWGNPTQGVGHYKIIDFDWSPGFRLNIGYFNAPHYWDTYLQFTHFKGRGDSDAKTRNVPNEFLNGTWPQPSFDLNGAPLAKARAKIELRFNLLEGLFSRRFHPNPHLRMRLLGGGAVLWLRQNWEVDYRDTAGQKSHIRNHWRFTGAGIRVGYMVDWFLGRGGFFFTGLVSGTIYAGSYHNVSRQTSTATGNGQFNPALPLRNVHYHDTRLVPQLQALAGPSWQMGFGKYRTELFIGYELNLLANLHEVYRTTTAGPTGAKETRINSSLVCMQGGTLRWNFDF